MLRIQRIKHNTSSPFFATLFYTGVSIPSLAFFGHWKATMLYHETHDPVLVKEFLGYKTLDTTLLYIQLENAIFKEKSNEFMVKATKDDMEIQMLLEVGFEYVCNKEGLMFFRKRK